VQCHIPNAILHESGRTCRISDGRELHHGCIASDAAMMQSMRTTVDLPDGLHAQAVALARTHAMSLSATVVSLVAKGLETVPHASHLSTDPVTGLVTVDLGRTFTPAEVLDLIDEDS
jgi:hypothetical protein